MSHDMETPFLSFSNPNYQPSCKPTKASQISENNNSEPVDINIMSLANEKEEQSKLLNREDIQSHTSEEEDNLSMKSEEVLSDEENDFVEASTKLLAEQDTDEKLNNTECINMAYGEKGKGILAYITMLEQSARERSERKRREIGDGGELEEGESGDTTPASVAENIKLKRFANAGFDINSPDSNDSGIQSDARSDDGTHTQSSSISEDLYAITNKSYLPRTDSGDDSEVTPTQGDENQHTEVLPPGWERCEDEDGAYFWHIKSGTIQREPPSPAPPDIRETLRSISINSDSSTVSGDSQGSTASTPSSVASTEDHLHEFEDHALQYAVKSLKNLSSMQRNSKLSESSEKPVRYAVSSLGWVPIAEEDLTPERSNKAVNKCILDLTLGRNDVNDAVGRWGDGKELYMDVDIESLRLIDTHDLTVLNFQPIHTIRVWGVGRENNRDFAYVARENLSQNYMCHVFRCDTPARHIANTLRDICKKIMMERTLQQKALSRLARPNDLPNLEPVTTPSPGEKMTFKSLYSNASFPTPMEEPKKVLRCHYLGSTLVNKPTGMEVLNSTIDKMLETVPPEKWQYVGVAVAPSTITITEHGNPDNKIDECRVRYLSFMGISISNVKLCAFIVHKAEDKFQAHVFHNDPNAGPLCKTIEAACKLRYQKCLDAQHRYLGKTRERRTKDEDSDSTPTENRTLKEEVKHGVDVVGTKVKPVLQHVQSGVKTGVHSVSTGLKTGVASVKSGVQTVSSMWSAFRSRKAVDQSNDEENIEPS
ncbi:amyloid beta precursor protein binding family B member 2-like isoform X2 [Mya arenaria]|uniref:amyloid beta precursor protein binding family B member 2-like isoform X2 n=1 Tax=Mya arenaria TaxID=6604 RepID=UPI0022E91A38|nr:amyloid beta precursor protein binding family B member 2-like isoform X2 [Mya arenaria]XP_052794458.1 amyloid beta precursor protein binding family B member 2-like isoform X2 [Mya arenaria]XP_052794460.1 amyloid beta precursor protein binding family B member 2-like isoform X2 [Mya arenaria]